MCRVVVRSVSRPRYTAPDVCCFHYICAGSTTNTGCLVTAREDTASYGPVLRQGSAYGLLLESRKQSCTTSLARPVPFRSHSQSRCKTAIRPKSTLYKLHYAGCLNFCEHMYYDSCQSVHFCVLIQLSFCLVM